MIGFKPQRRIRTPVYTASSEKVGYMYGDYYTDLDGIIVARITKYHIELPAASACVSGSHVVTPDSTYEG
jgi:hypothetical protein